LNQLSLKDIIFNSLCIAFPYLILLQNDRYGTGHFTDFIGRVPTLQKNQDLAKYQQIIRQKCLKIADLAKYQQIIRQILLFLIALCPLMP